MRSIPSANGQPAGYSVDSVISGENLYDEHGTPTGYSMDGILGGKDYYDASGKRAGWSTDSVFGLVVIDIPPPPQIPRLQNRVAAVVVIDVTLVPVLVALDAGDAGLAPVVAGQEPFSYSHRPVTASAHNHQTRSSSKSSSSSQSASVTTPPESGSPSSSFMTPFSPAVIPILPAVS